MWRSTSGPGVIAYLLALNALIAIMSIFWLLAVVADGFGVSLWSLTCPSCHNKKVVQFGHHLKETVLYLVPHRQYVFSILKILIKFFLYDRKLLGKLSQCAAKSLTEFFKIKLGKKTGIPGVVVAIQSFGDYARWHPHLHALVADSLFLDSGYFFVMPDVDLRPLGELFRAYTLNM